MTVKECYTAMGADYEDVCGRLRTEERIGKFLKKVLDDPSYDLLCDSLKKGDMEEAFRAAHTIKGIFQNLSLTKLYEAVAPLSDYLKAHNTDAQEIERMMRGVHTEYAIVRDCISQL
jgi:chemotaxis protein histidine kinase CheA